MSYLAIAKAVEARWKAEQERQVNKTLMSTEPDPTLAAAYRRYWQTAESEPMETFRAAYMEIARLEAQANPAVAWYTLRQAATAYHAERGICPFCREPGELHLPAEQPKRELRHG